MEMTDPFRILKRNNIATSVLERLPADRYQVLSEHPEPHAILMRSFDLRSQPLPGSLLAVGRAGIGVNNIPVDACSAMGVPVFNAPGGNANAVKELVLAGMLIACRNLFQAWDYLRELEGEPDEVRSRAEADKKQFAGFELPGKHLAIIGLGAIGVKVANAALALDMRVIGFDPAISVARAWELDSGVEYAESLEQVMDRADFVSFHVPLSPETRDLMTKERIRGLRKGAVILNFARDGIVDERAVRDALDDGLLHAYVCDFPGALRHERIIRLPHIGASTREAEVRCAEMVADQVRDYLDNGNIRNSVNYPNLSLPRRGQARLAVTHANIPDMLAQISHCLGRGKINIVHMANESRDAFAYTLADAESAIPESALDEIRQIEGVLKVRAI